MKYAFITLVVCSPFFSSAQTQDESGKQQLPNSLNPGVSRPTFFAPTITRRKKSNSPTIETYEHYVARIKRTVKAIRKYEKLMRKPQYSNPLYFGHKRKPKKHKAGKLKFCKECGIRH